jgi:tetratricopeptide (TPR) repeat protein
MVQALIAEAYGRFGQGDLEGAREVCQQALGQSLGDINAIQLLGLIAAQQGDFDEAEKQLQRATRITPDVAPLHNNLGSVYLDAGKLDEALAAFRRALKLKPRFAEAHINLGEASLRHGDAADALRAFQAVLKHEGGHVAALLGAARALSKLGRDKDLAAHYRKAANHMQTVPHWMELGRAMLEGGAVAEAISAYERARALDPENLSIVHECLGRLVDAGRYAEVLAVAQPYVDANPSAENYNLLGDLLRRADQPEQAAAALCRAIELAPDMVAPRHNLAVLYSDLGDHPTADDWAKQALALQPDLAEAACLRGSIALEQGDADAAIAYFDAVLAANPGSAIARWNRGLAELVAGRFASGWRDFDQDCFAQRGSRSAADLPRWDGQLHAGQRILLRGEQGVGDEIFFASVVADLLASGIQCQYEGDGRLAPLFERAFPGMRCHAYGKADHRQFDAQLPIGSLPAMFRQREQDFPGHAYLSADAGKAARWRERLGRLPGRLKVGIAWRGGVDPVARRQRSIALDEWAPLLGLPDIDFVSLQYGDHGAEIAAAEARHGIKLHRWNDCNPLLDLDQFAAQLSALDLVISIDNSTVHLAGALGVPTWMLLGGLGNWRWLLGRDDSPWYRSLRIYRRRLGEGAGTHLATLAETLRDWQPQRQDLPIAA